MSKCEHLDAQGECTIFSPKPTGIATGNDYENGIFEGDCSGYLLDDMSQFKCDCLSLPVKTYTQAELDQKLKEQREACAVAYKFNTADVSDILLAANTAILNATTGDGDEL